MLANSEGERMLKTILSIFIITATLLPISAAIKQDMVFTGNPINFCTESNQITVRNGKKEMSFFIMGKITRDGQKIKLSDVSINCPVSISYQKNRKQNVATRIIAMTQ